MQKTVRWCKVMVCFSSRNAFNTCKKDVLPAEYTNNVVYLFSCECSNSYVGRTSLRLRERMGQHILPEVINSVVGCEVVKRKRGRPLKASAATSLRLEPDAVSSRTCSKSTAAGHTESGAEHMSASELPSSGRNDKAITAHLRQSKSCREAVCKKIQDHFKILSKARHGEHLQTLEAVHIALRQPELCVQKDKISLSLLK